MPSLLRAVALLAVLPLAAPAASPDAAARRCQATKRVAVGLYDLCRARAEARVTKTGGAADASRCDAQLARKFARAEAKADGACPTTGDRARVQLASVRHGAAVAATLDGPASSGCSRDGLPFTYSYMMTNRATPFATSQPDIVPAAAGSLAFFTADGPYVAGNVQSAYTEVTRAEFVSRLAADLAKTTSGGALHLGLYVHGLGNTFQDALGEAADFGCALASPGGWPGLLVGFSWPSYDTLDSVAFYASAGPPPPTLVPQRSGTIRDNILGSRESFATVLDVLGDAVEAAGSPVELSVLTHSEGNYMLMTGMAALPAPAGVGHCLMLAADVSDVTLQTGEQGQAIADGCGDVTVYYSGADGDLVTSDYEFFAYHRTDAPTRLGLAGPGYLTPAPSALNADVTGVDCSRVTTYPAVPSIIDVHSSYRFVPAILADLVQTMRVTPHTGRTAIPGTAQGFVLAP